MKCPSCDIEMTKTFLSDGSEAWVCPKHGPRRLVEGRGGDSVSKAADIEVKEGHHEPEEEEHEKEKPKRVPPWIQELRKLREKEEPKGVEEAREFLKRKTWEAREREKEKRRMWEKGSQKVAQEVTVEEPLEVAEPAAPAPEAPKPADENLVLVTEWTTPKEFIEYIRSALKRVPPYSRTNAPGVERAIAYYDFLLKEISSVLRADVEGDLSLEELDELQQIRNTIESQQEALEGILKTLVKKRPKPRRRRSFEEEGHVVEGAIPEADKIRDLIRALKAKDEPVPEAIINLLQRELELLPRVEKEEVGKEDGSMKKEATYPKIYVTKSPFVFDLARSLVNSKVSSGKNIEEMFDKAKDQYNLTKREELELTRALYDMGYPIHRAIPNIVEFGPTNYYA